MYDKYGSQILSGYCQGNVRVLSWPVASGHCQVLLEKNTWPPTKPVSLCGMKVSTLSALGSSLDRGKVSPIVQWWMLTPTVTQYLAVFFKKKCHTLHRNVVVDANKGSFSFSAVAGGDSTRIPPLNNVRNKKLIGVMSKGKLSKFLISSCWSILAPALMEWCVFGPPYKNFEQIIIFA